MSFRDVIICTQAYLARVISCDDYSMFSNSTNSFGVTINRIQQHYSRKLMIQT